MIPSLSALKAVSARRWLLYGTVYFIAGLIMNSFGKMMQIAEFGHWWQVFTCYVLYLVPCSLLVRDRGLFDQYLFGLLALGILEFLGYSLETSYAYEGNILDALFGVRTFALSMTLFFAVILPAGNVGLARLESLLFSESPEPEPVPVISQD